MQISKLVMITGLSVSMLFSSSLLEKSKQNNLVPIPKSKEAVHQLIDNKDNPITKKKVSLGKKLYFDPRLSKSGLISCNTCHNLGLGGSDGLQAAVGHKWTANPHHLNSPTVYNSVFASSQFWDGRSPDLEDQAQGPIQAAPEMAAPKELVEQRINSIPQYVRSFKKAYGEDVKINFELIASTIALFERTLITPSRYDDFLLGNTKALSKAEKKGLELFLDKGCVSCHNGIALGGQMQAFELTGQYKYRDVGDFKGDKNGLVKTPTLRNITQTPPYFHNGAIWSLHEAIKEMGRIQLGVDLSKSEVESIARFFKALDGRKPRISYPQLPPSVGTTEKPALN